MRDVEVDNTGLDQSGAIGFVDFQDLTHARQLDHDALVQRQRPARQTRAGASRRERNIVTCEHTHYLRDLFSRRGEHDGARAIFVLR